MGKMTDWKMPGNNEKRLLNAVFRAGCPQFSEVRQRNMRTGCPKKSGNVDNFPGRRLLPENKFLNFYIMHKRSEILSAGRTHSLRLADGKLFQKPAQLLAGKQPYFRSIARPLEFPIVQAFRAEHETRLVKIQGLQRISFPTAEQVQGILIRIHLVSVPDNGHKAVEATPHVGAAGDDINFRITGQCA